MGGKKIDETVKQGVISDHKNGVSRKKIAEKFGISLSSVSKIVKEKPPQLSEIEVIQTKVKTKRQMKIEALERRIAELERKILERETIKGCV
jgi:predicted transcriptional regulator